MRSAVFALLCWTALAAWGDGAYERAERSADLAVELSDALERKDVPALMRLFADGRIRFFSLNGTADGRAETEDMLEMQLRDRANFPFERNALRVWSGHSEAWLLFSWTWGGEAGTLIARLIPGAEAVWRIADLDLHGETAKKPPAGFDSRTALEALKGPAELVLAAEEAIQGGNLNNLQPLLAPEYEFIDENGNRFEGPLALLAAAQTILPDEVAVERINLYLSPDERRSIAFQDVDLRRLSLMLLRLDGVWKLAGASMSVPYETLNVEDGAPLSVLWADLKRG